MQVTASEMKAKRLQTMRKGVVAAALAIDNKFRRELGEPIYKKALGRSKNPFHRDSPYRVALVTLTYRDGVAWEPQQINALLRYYRDYFRKGRKQGFHYVWVVELQGNGKPHYHVVMWFPKGITPPFPDDAGWWPHGMSNAVFARSPVGYVAKYASKSESKSGHHLPKGARLWGYGGLAMDERAGVAYAVCPRWLKSVIHHEAHPRKRVIETKVYRTAAGLVLPWVRRVAAWVVTAGEAVGWAFFSPYVVENISPNGIALSHSGVIEAVCPEGDSYFIPCKG